MKIIISDATVPGEGEHKVMNFIRSQRQDPSHNPNTRHVLYGLDADLIMLGLATHEPHFRVLREDVFFQESRPRTCRLCGQPGHKAEECRGEAKEKNGEFDEKQKAAPLKPFIWLNVSVLREYLAVELQVPQQRFPFDLERALDDWVFMCFFVGNDFLPHLPSLDIKENAIDLLISIWRENIPLMDDYVTKDGIVNFNHAQLILNGLGKQEDGIFRRRRQAEERKAANEQRRKEEEKARNAERSQKRRRSSPDYTAGEPGLSAPPAKGRKSGEGFIASTEVTLITPSRGHLDKQTRQLTHSMVVNRSAIYKANEANKSAAAALKSQLLKGKVPASDETETTNSEVPSGEEESLETSPAVLGKRKAEDLTDADNGTPGRDSPVVTGPSKPSDDMPPDTVRLWESGYTERYYEQKFHVDPSNVEFRHQVARSYAEGLQWVLLYYMQGCPSWTWYYPYHYAPFAADFVDISSMKPSFEKGKPFRPFEQLMGVLPASSNHAIPEIFHDLMSDPDSEIIDFYPEDFPVDLNGKKFAWQGVVLLPFIDETRLLAAMEKKYPFLSADEHARNTVGTDVLLLSDQHPLYQELAANFYSKKQGALRFALDMRVSEGLAGKVERDDNHIPHSSLDPPCDVDMPSLDENRSMMYVMFTFLCVLSNTNILQGQLRDSKIKPSTQIHAPPRSTVCTSSARPRRYFCCPKQISIQRTRRFQAQQWRRPRRKPVQCSTAGNERPSKPICSTPGSILCAASSGGCWWMGSSCRRCGLLSRSSTPSTRWQLWLSKSVTGLQSVWLLRPREQLPAWSEPVWLLCSSCGL